MTALQELRPIHGKPLETNRWPGIIFVIVLHIAGIYALIDGLGNRKVALLRHNIQAVVTTEVVKDDLPPPAPPPNFQPPPVVAIQPEVQIALAQAPPPVTTITQTPAVIVAPPTPPTPPAAITSHAVTADDYPPVSIRLQEQGLVKIKYLVKADGMVGDCAVTGTSGKSRLDDAACTMVKKRWRFKPATQGGKPVAEYLLTDVIFKLQ
jgi:periplasmic protein TonB